MDKHISELLFEHDCVVIPGFGGLVTNPKPASVNTLQHRFSPPSRQISFNRQLTNNDGLLANAVAGKEKITYKESVQKIASAVNAWERSLKDNQKINLNNIGTFCMSGDDKVLFEPDTSVNYDLMSFGLPEFISPPIQREDIHEAIVRKITKKETASAASTTDWKMVAAVPLFIAIGALLTWTMTNFGLLGGVNYAGMDQGIGQEEVRSTRDEGRSEEPEVRSAELGVRSEGTGSELTITKEDEGQTGIENVEEAEPSVAKVKEAAPIAPATPVQPEDLPYHIIGGCFSVYDNAERMEAELREQGHHAVIVGQNNKGLHRVSYGGYATKDEALNALSAIRQNNNSAWLLAL